MNSALKKFRLVVVYMLSIDEQNSNHLMLLISRFIFVHLSDISLRYLVNLFLLHGMGCGLLNARRFKLKDHLLLTLPVVALRPLF